MSTTALNPFPLNQTTSFIETSTYLDNATYRDYSSIIETSTYLDNLTYRDFSSIFETSTYLDNATYRNFSSIGGKRPRKVPQLFRWTSIDVYRYSNWGVVLFIIFSGIIGNFLMLIMMSDTKLTSMSYSVYLKCLAVTDSLLLSIRLLNQIHLMFSLNKITPEYYCLITFSLMYVVAIFSPWLVVGLTFDRYICVCFPLKRDIVCTKSKAIIICTTLCIVSVLLISPFPAETEVTKGQCTPSDAIKSYSVFLLLSVPSILPCLFILVLNILLIIQIQRSRKFRETFARSNKEASRGQLDSSTRPLVLVSVMAFFTLMPVAISKVVSVLLGLWKLDRMTAMTNNNVRTILYTIYLMNFGQNFYILIFSSSNYRAIIKRRLYGCFSVWKRRNMQIQGVQESVLSQPSASASDSTRLSLILMPDSDKTPTSKLSHSSSTVSQSTNLSLILMPESERQPTSKLNDSSYATGLSLILMPDSDKHSELNDCTCANSDSTGLSFSLMTDSDKISKLNDSTPANSGSTGLSMSLMPDSEKNPTTLLNETSCGVSPSTGLSLILMPNNDKTPISKLNDSSCSVSISLPLDLMPDSNKTPTSNLHDSTYVISESNTLSLDLMPDSDKTPTSKLNDFSCTDSTIMPLDLMPDSNKTPTSNLHDSTYAISESNTVPLDLMPDSNKTPTSNLHDSTYAISESNTVSLDLMSDNDKMSTSGVNVDLYDNDDNSSSYPTY